MPMKRRDHAVDWEPLSILRDDGLAELVREHHAEVGVYKDKMPLDVDWAGYHEDEVAGTLRILGARIDGALIGYSSFYVLKAHRHYRSTVHAMGDAIFVRATHRRSGIGIELIDKAELDITQEFRGRWVRFWYHDKAFLERIGPVLKKRGYAHNENCWDKMARAN